MERGSGSPAELRTAPITGGFTPASGWGVKTGAGYAGTWDDDTADPTIYTLYSSAEKINGSSGTYGNGVSQANLDAVNDSGGTFALKPVPIGTPVFAIGMFMTDNSIEWWITNLPNGVDGAC